MKTLYKSIFVMGLGIVSLTATAQRDSVLTRQVLLEREYSPTLQEASRINTLPSIYSPVIKPKEIKFINSTPQIKITNNQLGSAESGDIGTGVDFSKKRGYIVLGAGNNSNIEGALGYRVVNGERDRLDIFANHSSTSGTIDYLKKDIYSMDNAKAKYSASKVNLKYQHKFDPTTLWFDGSFFNTAFNYYGNPFIPKGSSIMYPFDINSRQNVDVFSIGAGINPNVENGDGLQYSGGINYQNFKSKYATEVPGQGPKGYQLDVNANFYMNFDSDMTVGIKGLFANQAFNNDVGFSKDAYHDFTNITGTPYAKFQGESWNADLGVNISSLLDVKANLLFSPNIKAAIHIFDVNTLYAEVTGGINNNTFLDILMENRYANLGARVEYSKTLYDAKIGFKSGVVSGLEFDIFAGYKQTNKDHLYLYKHTGYDPSSTTTHWWGNVSTPLYANVGTGHIGGLLKTNLIPYTDLSARMTAYFYNVKYTDGYNELITEDIPEKKAWGRPSFTAELNADVKPFDKLTLSLGYLFAGGRKTYFMDSFNNTNKSVTMNSINELNFRGEYQILDWVSANVRLNNILFQKYELQYGYPQQGFNILGGLSFKF